MISCFIPVEESANVVLLISALHLGPVLFTGKYVSAESQERLCQCRVVLQNVFQL